MPRTSDDGTAEPRNADPARAPDGAAVPRGGTATLRTMTTQTTAPTATDAERTLVLVKPDGVRRGLAGEVLRRIEAKGYALIAVELMNATHDLLDRHYAEHVGKPFYPGLVDFMLSGPILAVVAEGNRVVEGFRTLAGPTDPTTAPPGTIRGDLARAWGTPAMQNVVHGSDSPESADREIALWFPTL